MLRFALVGISVIALAACQQKTKSDNDYAPEASSTDSIPNSQIVEPASASPELAGAATHHPLVPYGKETGFRAGIDLPIGNGSDTVLWIDPVFGCHFLAARMFVGSNSRTMTQRTHMVKDNPADIKQYCEKIIMKPEEVTANVG